jgi:hypothetical protein
MAELIINQPPFMPSFREYSTSARVQYAYSTGSPTWTSIGARPPPPRYSAPIVRPLALLGILRRLKR